MAFHSQYRGYDISSVQLFLLARVAVCVFMLLDMAQGRSNFVSNDRVCIQKEIINYMVRVTEGLIHRAWLCLNVLQFYYVAMQVLPETILGAAIHHHGCITAFMFQVPRWSPASYLWFFGSLYNAYGEVNIPERYPLASCCPKPYWFGQALICQMDNSFLKRQMLLHSGLQPSSSGCSGPALRAQEEFFFHIRVTMRMPTLFILWFLKWGIARKDWKSFYVLLLLCMNPQSLKGKKNDILFMI